MAGITFTEGSGLQDSVYGKSQAPIRMFIEKQGEAFEQQSIVKEIFNMETSKNWAEKITGMTSMDGFKAVGENGDYPHDSMQEGYDKLFEHMTWKDSFSISREMVEDNKILDLRRQPREFTAGYYRTREKFGAALLGGALSGESSITFATKKFTTLTADGVNLFSKAHPSKLKKSAQSNMFADAFSNDTLMAAEERMQGFCDDNGNILDVVPDMIIIPNSYKLKKDVFAAIGADKDPNTANNGFNYNFGRWTVVVWPYLNQFIKAGTLPWILGASEFNKAYGGAVWFDRTQLEVRSEIADNDANVWKGYSRFTAGFANWRAFAAGGMTGGDTLIAG